MNFSSLSYIFLFLPITAIIYYFAQYLAKKVDGNKLRSGMLSIFSAAFYIQSGFVSYIVLFIMVLVVYGCGYLIRKNIEIGVHKKKLLIGSVALFLIVLCLMKYCQSFTGIRSILGISFITFSALSYIVDIYRGDAETGSLLDCLLYLTFFPKVISGPIVKWKEFKTQGLAKEIDTYCLVAGINRIVVGLTKKVILADSFGTCIMRIQEQRAIDRPTAWLFWLLYALEIYYDFSGYSDMAIGSAKIFGLDLSENFNFPYRSLSITEFWRRWHISLGSFFKDYVYIPLGGNRKGNKRTLINLAIVFLLTGIWHGAGWAYLLWGSIHGACMLIERIVFDKRWYKKIPSVVKWTVTFAISSTAWLLFKFEKIGLTLSWLKKMLIESDSGEFIVYRWQFFCDTRMISLIVIALIGALGLGEDLVLKTYNKYSKKYGWYVLREIIVIFLFFLSITFLVNSTFSPFIYFQF